MMMVMSRWCCIIWLATIHHLKVRHHSRCMMLNDMAMIHPGARTIIRHPGNFYFTSGGQIIGIFSCPVRRCFAILFDDLEEKAVEVKRMIH